MPSLPFEHHTPMGAELFLLAWDKGTVALFKNNRAGAMVAVSEMEGPDVCFMWSPPQERRPK